MSTVARKPDSTGRRPAIPFAAIGARHTRQTSQVREGCPCCGAPLSATKPVVDMGTHAIIYKNQSVHLERNEALLMQKLAQRMPAVVTHDSLIGHVWDIDEPEDARGCVKQHMHHLRRKLAPLGLDIVNIFSVGYRLVVL